MKNDEHTLLEAGGETSQSALDILLRRMQTVSDFPALSEAIGAINRIASSDREGVNALSNNILKDFALTNKLLRLANVAFYNQVGGGSISSCRLGCKAQHQLAIVRICEMVCTLGFISFSPSCTGYLWSGDRPITRH